MTESGIRETRLAVRGTSVLGAGVSLGLADRGAGVLKSALEKVELLEWVDLLELLVDYLELSWASFWATI